MHTMMLVGETGVGKRTLMAALAPESCAVPKTLSMAVEFCGPFVNTPGAFLENRRFYFALITASADCRTVALIQDATRNTSLFPPQFASAFNRTVVGIVSKTDASTAHVERAQRFLRSAGATTIILLSVTTGQGLAEVRALLD